MMNKKRNYAVFVVVAIVLLVSLACQSPAATPTPPPTAKPAPTVAALAATPTPARTPTPTPAAKVRLRLVGAPAASSWFILVQAEATVANKYAGDAVEVTTLESSGGYDTLSRLVEGTAELFSTGNLEYSQDVYLGEGPFKGKPFKDLRAFYGFNVGGSAGVAVVRADLPIYKLQDLNGQKFNPGKPGADEVKAKNSFGVLGIKPDWYPGASTEAVAAMKNRQIVGFMKYTAGRTQLDATMLDMMATQKIRLLGFTEEEKEKVKLAYPKIYWAYVEKGQFKELPDSGGFWAWSGFGLMGGTAKVPQYAGYRIIKAFFEHSDEILAAYPQWELSRPKDTIKGLADVADVLPMHAGVIQYWKELGLDVPAKLIPPEYKG